MGILLEAHAGCDSTDLGAQIHFSFMVLMLSLTSSVELLIEIVQPATSTQGAFKECVAD